MLTESGLFGRGIGLSLGHIMESRHVQIMLFHIGIFAAAGLTVSGLQWAMQLIADLRGLHRNKDRPFFQMRKAAHQDSETKSWNAECVLNGHTLPANSFNQWLEH